MQMKRSRAKLAIFYAVLVLGLFAVGELLAFATYLIAFPEPFSYDSLQSQRLAVIRLMEEESVGGRADGPPWLIHPYYGFVSNPSDRQRVDKFGFFGHEDQIQVAAPDKVVVAIIGGSVAARLASSAFDGEILEAELKKSRPLAPNASLS
jgi:hypothetical protein